LLAGVAFQPELAEARAKAQSADSHLRGSDAVHGYSIESSDGDIGHLVGFLLDDETWAVRYLEVATRNWWPGKKVLVAPSWIESVSWMDSKIHTGLTREAIRTAPEYADGIAVTRRIWVYPELRR